MSLKQTLSDRLKKETMHSHLEKKYEARTEIKEEDDTSNMANRVDAKISILNFETIIITLHVRYNTFMVHP